MTSENEENLKKIEVIDANRYVLNQTIDELKNSLLTTKTHMLLANKQIDTLTKERDELKKKLEEHEEAEKLANEALSE